DHRLAEMAVSLPVNLKLRGGYSKYILRKAMEDKVPPEITWRKDKKGFVTPQADWKEQSARMLTGFLSSCSMPDFLRRDRILAAIRRRDLHPTQGNELWKIAVLLKWIEIFSIK
ncbi:MAG TPA: asparagine synthase-related protein, partial [Bacteroidales bacterium]|nr:asparagine synthase-related protein [Bacteroidales bacterium]